MQTGEDSSKSERLLKVKNFVDDSFFVAYGDDLADINVKELLSFHKKSKTITTVTAVRVQSQFGVMELGKTGIVKSFEEKPILDYWTNGGFMVFEKKIFDYLKLGELEKEVFEKLVKEKQLSAFMHKGKWRTMNTLKDNLELNDLWKKKQAFWKV